MNECEEQIDKEYNELQKGNLICAHNNYKNKGKLNDSESSKNNSDENNILYSSGKSSEKEIPKAKRGIPLDTKKINQTFNINRLKKINMNKVNHKKNKKNAMDQYKPPKNKMIFNYFCPNNNNNISPIMMNQMNNQSQFQNNPNNFANNNFIQNNQFMNNINRNNQMSQMMNNNFGMNNTMNMNMNMNNYNQRQAQSQNIPQMQQMNMAMQNMNLNRNNNMNNINMNNQNRFQMNMMNNFNNFNNMNNNMQNQNIRFNGINLGIPLFFGNNNSNNQEEIRITRIVRETTEKGQKVTRYNYKTSFVKNDKNIKYQK
jgi:hypothetical protein